jgi:hypothetical protein
MSTPHNHAYKSWPAEFDDELFNWTAGTLYMRTVAVMREIRQMKL